jgi:hypothetical protein
LIALDESSLQEVIFLIHWQYIDSYLKLIKSKGVIIPTNNSCMLYCFKREYRKSSVISLSLFKSPNKSGVPLYLLQ